MSWEGEECEVMVLYTPCPQAARSYGYVLTAKSQHWATVHTPHRGAVKFEVLQTLEFDSVRKCMSVIVREEGTEALVLYSKGADSTIYRNLSHRSGLPSSVYHKMADIEDHTNTRAAITEQHLNMYSKLGLRTLCLAKRVKCVGCV